MFQTSFSMSVPVTRPTKNRRSEWYQLSPYNKVSRGVKAKFKVGHFYVNNSLSFDQLKLIQYAFDRDGNGRYLQFIWVYRFYSPIYMSWLPNTLVVVFVFNEILVSTDDQFLGIIAWVFYLTQL